MDGKNFENFKTWLIVTFHPAYLMRQPTQKKLRVDLKMIRDLKSKLIIIEKKVITGRVDEAGRCLAGPVVSAAVILNKKVNLGLLKDPKLINFDDRIKIAEHIKLNSIYAIGIANVKEIRFKYSSSFIAIYEKGNKKLSVNQN